MSVPLPKFLYGGVSAGEWPKLKASDYARTCVAAGVNCCGVLEAMAPAYTPDGWGNQTPAQCVEALCGWIQTMQREALWSIVHLINGNDDDRLKHFGVQAWKDAVHSILATCGTERIILVPVAEIQNNGEDEFCQWCRSVWYDTHRGIMGWNGSGRPQSVPSGYTVLDYHTQDPMGDLGPSIPGVVTVLDTDNGVAIAQLKGSPYWNASKVYQWAARARGMGRSVNLYAASWVGVDSEALKALGSAYGDIPPQPEPPIVPPKPPKPPAKQTWLQKLKAWWDKVRGKK